ncbi:MAG: WecB/TagA/CpsF family glycosyltransferase [Opitutales bacterium]
MPQAAPRTSSFSAPVESRYILRQRVDATSYPDAVARILAWAKAGDSRQVCLSDVHMVMESYDRPDFRKIVNESDLVTPDGMPLVWALRLWGIRNPTRVYGPDLTIHLLEAAARKDLPIGLYGGTEESLETFVSAIEGRFPDARITCKIAPPFRPLTEEEDDRYTRQIVESKASILFVGIGCPKQELWIAAHKGIIPAVMLGVGAAFDFHSHRVRQAPRWMQGAGLEWLFRVSMEPRRLWKRYAKHNPRFIILITAAWIRSRLTRSRSPHRSKYTAH